MKVAITGATGFVGTALVSQLRAEGHETIRVSRQAGTARDAVWNPSQGTIEAHKLEGLDAVVHLAGESIASGRWNEQKKARIRDSRVQGSSLLSSTLAKLKSPPKTLVSASAIGFYGDRGDAVCNEDSAAGTGFLADVCRAWEAACQPAVNAGIRVVNSRFGIVLSPRDGALAKMLLPFKLGLGGVVGSGTQYWSWISLDDVVSSIIYCLNTGTLRGPVNAVAPAPATNHVFTKTLGHVLNRPTIFPMPAFAARLALGEMADALLLASTRVVPERLQNSGYSFQYPELGPALKHLLNK